MVPSEFKAVFLEAKSDGGFSPRQGLKLDELPKSKKGDELDGVDVLAILDELEPSLDSHVKLSMRS